MLNTEIIKAEAQRLGFDLIGITDAKPVAGFSRFTEWLAGGYHASMQYLDTPRSRALRAAPEQVLPGCQTILCVGKLYPKPLKMKSTTPDQARIAAYAWQSDYHLELPPLMENLVAFIQKLSPIQFDYKIYTDSGPVLEKELGQRAGLGWIGKNSCLINPLKGSMFLLGEIFLTLKLPVDPPFLADRCGTCTRCLDACPTGCILPDRTLDANRCISFLTIENKGAIPPDLRPLIGEWAFGCDICQMVCPWNQRREAETPENQVRLNIPETLKITPQEFNRKYKDSPLLRARRKGLVRNACITAGNYADEKSLPDLIRVLESDPSEVARGAAAWAIGRIGGPAAKRALTLSLPQEQDERVLEEIQEALLQIESGKPLR
jgi:epoxyqueuosine reductase